MTGIGWTITFDCAEPAVLAAFWREALGYVDGAPPAGLERANGHDPVG
jgi:hypothetical protein